MVMNDKCPVCGQATDIEVGFYYGTGYISYLVGLLITAISCIIWVLLIGFSFKDKRFLSWLIINSVLLIFGLCYLVTTHFLVVVVPAGNIRLFFLVFAEKAVFTRG